MAELQTSGSGRESILCLFQLREAAHMFRLIPASASTGSSLPALPLLPPFQVKILVSTSGPPITYRLSFFPEFNHTCDVPVAV